MAGRGIALALVILTVVTLLTPSVVAGPVDGGDPPPSPPPSGGDPPGMGPGADGAGAGPSGGGNGGPTPPPPTTYTKTPYKIPYADLRVKLLRSDREVVAPSQLVQFTIEKENVGYLTASSANLTMYNNVISNGTAIAWTDLDMRDFQGKTVLTWIASGLGDHTILAFVDANYTVKEISETNNTASVVVRVQTGGGPGVPDIMVNERDVGLSAQPQAGQPTTLKVEVRNIWGATASNVAVRVTDNGATINFYTIASLSTTASNVRSITWTPAAEGPHVINVTAAEGNTIRELSEDNNFASTGIGVKPFPLPGCVQNKGEWTIPSGSDQAYTNCVIYATNVTVNGILRLLSNTRLWVGRLYPITIGGSVIPRPLPSVAWHNLKINSGGILVVTGSTITTWQAAYAFGFEAKVGSAFYMNATSYAYFPWGRWPVPFGVGQHWGNIEGGLIVRTNSFSFKESTVAFGRLHGLFLDGVAVPSPGLQNNVFRDSRGAGLAALKASNAYIAGSRFSRNAFGLYQRGEAPSSISTATVTSSLFEYSSLLPFPSFGIDSDVRSFVNVTGNTGTGKGFRERFSIAIRITWWPGTPDRTDPVVSNSFVDNLFGVYAYYASPEIRANTFVTDPGIPFRTHVTLHQSPYVTQSGQEWPRVEGNSMSRAISAPFDGLAVNVYGMTVPIRGNAMAIPQGISCIGAACRVETNVMSVCWGVAAVALSNLSWTAGNSINHLGCGETWGVIVDSSRATLRDGLIGQSETLLDVCAATALQVVNVTFSDLNPATSGGSDIKVRLSNAALFDDNDMLNVPIAIYDSRDLVFKRNSQRSDIGDGMELNNATNALVEYNTFESPFRYTPTNPPVGGQIDRGHVKVYNNATATVRWNVLRNGSWGVSLDDIRSGPLSLPLRSTYALVQGNWINDTGYVAFGVNSSTRGDALGNQVLRSSGWGLFMESSFAGNRMENNTVDVCHGLNADSYGACVRISVQDLSGQVVVANNTISRGNVSGIYVRDNYNVVIRDNIVSNVTGKTVNEYGECITIVSAIAVPVINNVLRDCRIGVRIQKGTGHDLMRNTVQNITVANVTWGLRLDDTGGAIVWADVHDNNTFSGWTYGVWINAQFVDPNAGKFRLWWSDVRLNQEGVHVQGDPVPTWGANKYFHAECNWWNHLNGPDDDSLGLPDQWDNNPGQDVSDFFFYRDQSDNDPYWLDVNAGQETECVG